MWVQHTIMDFHGVTNTGSMWVLKFQPHRLQDDEWDQIHCQTTVLCGIVQIVGGGGVAGR